MNMTCTLQKTRIDADRPWVVSFTAPETEVADVAGRRAQVEASLTALAPIVRPLAISVDRCFRQLDTGLPAREIEPQPSTAGLVGDLARFGAVLRAAQASPPKPSLRDALSPAIVGAWLDSLCATREAAGIADWRSLDTLAVQVRTEADQVELTGLSRTLTAVREGRGGWVAGPVDEHGFGRWAPMALRWSAEYGRISLELSVHWMRWAEPGTKEQDMLQSALAVLESSGWTRAEYVRRA